MTGAPSDAAVFATSARLRREIADWVDTLDDDQLATRSLCERWTVLDVAGHLTSAVTVSTGQLVRQVLRRRGHLHRANADLAVAEARRPTGALTARLRAAADTPLRPPVVGARGPLTDLLVHDGDMRLPLGLPLRCEPEAAVVALGFLTGRAPGFVPRDRLRGLRVVAVDTGHAWGAGAEVRGTAGDLMMALCGRRVTLPLLDGPGAAILSGRG